jgi:hypothetical protein
MGCWDIYCFICGNPCHGLLDDELNESKLIKKSLNWMNKCTMLLVDNTIVHNVREYSCNTSFSNKNFKAEHLYSFDSELNFKFNLNQNYGIFIHTDCYNFIKKNYNINLKFSYLPKFDNLIRLYNINYGEIEKYWEQDFNFQQIILDKKLYLCSSPLKNDKNIKQIKKNVKALKIKNISRVGPLVSASFYNENDIKLGNDKYLWIKKNNKWQQINEKPIKLLINLKKNTKHESYLEKLRYIGQYDIKPIFIVSNKNNILEIITLESYTNILSKKIYYQKK